MLRVTVTAPNGTKVGSFDLDERQRAPLLLRTSPTTARANLSGSVDLVTGEGDIDVSSIILNASSSAQLGPIPAISSGSTLSIEIVDAPLKDGFAGQPAAGRIRWGCSYNSNSVPSPHETAAGVPVGSRRTFWDMSKTSSLLAAVKADHSAGRIPWVSVKLLRTWKEVAAGAIDASLINLFNGLKATGKPVWFTAHHEPEGGNGTPYPDDGQGTEGDWRAMQAHIAKLLAQVDAPNVAFGPILMAWTWDPRSKRNPNDWWVEGIWDFYGIDLYQSSEAGPAPVDQAMWLSTLAWFEDKDIPIGIAEWGNRGTDAIAATEMQKTYDHFLEVGVFTANYFDTTLNGGTPLSGEPLAKFRQLMKAPTSVYGL